MQQPPSSLYGQYAGFVGRALAFIIDTVTIYVMTVTVSWLTQNALSLIGVDIANCPTYENWLSLEALRSVVCNMARGTLIATVVLAPAFYFVLMWWLVGQTVGNGVVGIRVVQTNGHRLSLWRAILRFIGYSVSMLLLGIGFLWVLVDPRRQGWHDKMAHSVVVYAWEARQDDDFVARVRKRLHLRRA